MTVLNGFTLNFYLGYLKSNLKPNDFNSFDRFLIEQSRGKESVEWDFYYRKHADMFLPPIPQPKTMAEYQLDHYALWMIISIFNLKNKPFFGVSEEYIPDNRCYACSYIPDDNCEACPISEIRYRNCYG